MRKLPPGPKPAWRPRGQIITSIRVERFTCTNLELRFFSQFGPSDSGFQYLFSWQSIAGRKYLIICSLFDWLWAFDCVLKGFVFTPAWGWHAVPLCSSNGPCCASPQGLITQSSAPSNCYLVSKLLYVSSRLIYCFLLGFLGFSGLCIPWCLMKLGGGG